eukprot:9498150-Pyramimonas_sp.AAC.1
MTFDGGNVPWGYDGLTEVSRVCTMAPPKGPHEWPWAVSRPAEAPKIRHGSVGLQRFSVPRR